MPWRSWTLLALLLGDWFNLWWASWLAAAEQYPYLSNWLPVWRHPAGMVCVVAGFVLAFVLVRPTRGEKLRTPRLLKLEVACLSLYGVMQVYALLPVPSINDASFMWRVMAVLWVPLLFRVMALAALVISAGARSMANRRSEFAPTVPLELIEDAAPPVPGTRLTIVVACVLHVLLAPAFAAQGSLMLRLSHFGVPSAAMTLVGYLVAVVMARLLLTRALRADAVHVGRPNVAIRVAFAMLVIFFLIRPAAFVLSAIPYGGGRTPPEVARLGDVAVMLGFLGLVHALRTPAKRREARK